MPANYFLFTMSGKFNINEDDGNKVQMRVVHKQGQKDEYINLEDVINYFKDIAATLQDPNDKELVYTLTKVFIRFKNRDKSNDATTH